MQLDYFSLLSPEPFSLVGIGKVKSPKLIEISRIGIGTYFAYLNYLLMRVDEYYQMLDTCGIDYFSSMNQSEQETIIQIRKEYESYSQEEQLTIPLYNIIIFDRLVLSAFCEIFNFFFVESVEYDSKQQCFLLYDGSINGEGVKKITGVIHSGNFAVVVDIILQRVHIKRSDIDGGNLKVKNKIAAKLLEKMRKAEKENKKKSDKKMDLGNMVSSISAHARDLNIINVWEITIFQLYDQLSRQRIEDSYTIASTSMSVWGDKKNTFDGDMWLQNINDN